MVKSRYVFLTIVLLAIVMSMALGQGFEYAATLLGFADLPLLDGSTLRASHVAGYLVAFGGAAYLLLNRQTAQLSDEVADELTRVSWPSREETTSSTRIVFATVILAALILGGLDLMWNRLTSWVYVWAVGG